MCKKVGADGEELSVDKNSCTRRRVQAGRSLPPFPAIVFSSWGFECKVAHDSVPNTTSQYTPVYETDNNNHNVSTKIRHPAGIPRPRKCSAHPNASVSRLDVGTPTQT